MREEETLYHLYPEVGRRELNATKKWEEQNKCVAKSGRTYDKTCVGRRVSSKTYLSFCGTFL
jgi:hypothetical protein